MSIPIGRISKNSRLLRDILVNSQDLETSSRTMDQVLNSCSITYSTVDDYRKNFPMNNELGKKINLIFSRLRNG